MDPTLGFTLYILIRNVKSRKAGTKTGIDPTFNVSVANATSFRPGIGKNTGAAIVVYPNAKLPVKQN